MFVQQVLWVVYPSPYSQDRGLMISWRSETVPVASWGLAQALLWFPCPAITARKPLPSSAPLSCWEQFPEQEVGGMLPNLSALVGALCRTGVGMDNIGTQLPRVRAAPRTLINNGAGHSKLSILLQVRLIPDLVKFFPRLDWWGVLGCAVFPCVMIFPGHVVRTPHPSIPVLPEQPPVSPSSDGAAGIGTSKLLRWHRTVPMARSRQPLCRQRKPSPAFSRLWDARWSSRCQQRTALYLLPQRVPGISGVWRPL